MYFPFCDAIIILELPPVRIICCFITLKWRWAMEFYCRRLPFKRPVKLFQHFVKHACSFTMSCRIRYGKDSVPKCSSFSLRILIEIMPIPFSIRYVEWNLFDFYSDSDICYLKKLPNRIRIARWSPLRSMVFLYRRLTMQTNKLNFGPLGMLNLLLRRNLSLRLLRAKLI